MWIYNTKISRQIDLVLLFLVTNHAIWLLGKIKTKKFVNSKEDLYYLARMQTNVIIPFFRL